MKRVITLVAFVFGCLFCVSSIAAANSLAGDLLVATHSSGYQTFWTVDPATGTKTQHGTAGIGYQNDGMGFSGGKLYVAQDQDFRVVEVDLASGAFSVTASESGGSVNFSNIRDMTIASDGGLWVLCNNDVSRIDPVTGNQDPFYGSMYGGPGELSNPFSMATEASGMMLRSFVKSTANGDGGITRLDPATGTESLLASGMDNPWDLAVADDGSIFVVEEQNYGTDYIGIHRIDPVTGAETVVSTDPLLGSSSGELAWVPGHGLFKVDYSTDSILSIDVTTGAVSTLTTFSGSLKNRMTVVPEPATLSLLAIGGLAMLKRKRK